MINQDVRRRAEEALGLEGKVPEAIWTYLAQNGMVAAVERGEQDINWLTDELWKLLEASGRRRRLLEAPRMLSSGQRERAESREAVLAILCWDEARRDRAVSEFRSQVLNGVLLSPEEVEDWMTRQAANLVMGLQQCGFGTYRFPRDLKSYMIGEGESCSRSRLSPWG